MTDKDKIEILRKAATIVGNEPVEKALVVERWLNMLADDIKENSTEEDL